MALTYPSGAELTHTIIGAGIEVHRHLGPGLFESVYRRCLVYELETRGITTQVELAVPLRYKALEFASAYRLDLLVANEVIVEVKAVETLSTMHHAQLLTYLRMTGLKSGLLLNFHAPTLREGIRRILLEESGTRWNKGGQTET